MPLTLEGRHTYTLATIRKCQLVKTSVESFVPSLQWSPSRFVTWCHREKIQNFCICHFFGVRKMRDKICAVQTSNLTSDVRRLFTRRRDFPQSIAQPSLFYSVHVIIASCEVSIKHKTRVRQKPFVLWGDGRRRMLRNIMRPQTKHGKGNHSSTD